MTDLQRKHQPKWAHSRELNRRIDRPRRTDAIE